MTSTVKNYGLTWTGKAVGKNRMHVPARGRLIKTAEYRTFLEELAVTFRSQRTGDMIPGEFTVAARVTVGPRTDGHNLIDPIFDALEQGGIVENDRYLTSLSFNIRRHKQGEPDVIDLHVQQNRI